MESVLTSEFQQPDSFVFTQKGGTMLYETFHLLKEYAGAHPENLQNITEKEFRQSQNMKRLGAPVKTNGRISSLPDDGLLCAFSK